MPGVCDPICQTGCGANQGCVFGGPDPMNPMAACTPLGQGGQGDACGGTEGCLEGFACLLESSTDTMGTCQQYCRPGGGEPSCGEGFDCIQQNQDATLGVCGVVEDDCTVLPDSCDEGQNCINTPSGLRCIDYNDQANLGDSCSTADACNDGQRCLGPANGATCTAICDPATPMNNPLCAAGEQCVGVMFSDGTTATFGACRAP